MLNYLIEHNRYLNLIGIAVILAIAFIFSKNRQAINFRVVASAFVLHGIFASLMLKVSWGTYLIEKVAQGATKLSFFADKGIEFMFGKLSNSTASWGFIFAFKVLPIIIFIGALTGLLFHWGIIQRIVFAMNSLIRPIIGTSGVETTAAIATSILGQTEASLFMSNYIHVMTRSELFVLICSGMTAISISVIMMNMLIGIPGAPMLTASIMSIPASMCMAKILVPETEASLTSNKPLLTFEKKTTNAFDAISKGAMDGLQLAFAVAAMLIAFLSLLAMADFLLNLSGYYINEIAHWLGWNWSLPELSIGLIFSYFFLPFAYLLGFTGSELWDAGKLLGIKITSNELLAFKELMTLSFSSRSFLVVVFALCGFSNFSCIGVQIGMISALAPEKKHTITQLGLYALLGSSLANLLTAMVVALII
jgi:concentrative nucleoside transporter, CNT family